MKKITSLHLSLIFGFMLALYFVQPVLAHGTEPRLEISMERLSPGDTLQVRGVDFEYDSRITVELVDANTHLLIVSLGEATTDLEGVFIQNIILPSDLREGVYALRAIAYDHEIFSPSFTIWGIAMQNEESNVIRDQSDVQFEPITALPPDIASTVVSQTISPVQPVSNRNQNLSIIYILLGAGILIALGLRIKKK